MNELKRQCPSCGQSFTLTSIEVRAYNVKGWPIPNRCRSCREQQRNAEPEPQVLQAANRRLTVN